MRKISDIMATLVTRDMNQQPKKEVCFQSYQIQ